MTEVYIDTASLEEISKWIDRGLVTGVTTNQKIFLDKAKGCNFEEQAKKILQLAYPLPVSLEGPNDYQGIIDAALRYTNWTGAIKSIPPNGEKFDNVVIKVPMLSNGDGLSAAAKLKQKHIKTNVTACMTLNQTFLAASAGATYVSLFYNRMMDWKYSLLEPKWKPGTPKIFDVAKGSPATNRIARERQETSMIQAKDYALETIDNTMALLEDEFCETKLIVGSIRSAGDIEDILTVEPHIITIPTKILELMPAHVATDSALADFDKAWQEFCKEEKKI
jgi:transaldolase